MKSGKRMGVVVAIAVAIFSANRVAHQREQDRPQVAAPTSTVAVAKAPAATWTLGSLTLTACSLGQPNSGLSTAAWCADFSVPENRADPHSRTIQLKLAVLRARAQVAKSDMLVFLAGGPGQAATESAGSVAAVMNQLLAHRHLLLLDQRGTGGSNALRCKESDDPATADDDASFDADKLRDAAAACLKQLQTHADPRYYTTTLAAQDLEDVRKALGSPALDLVGVSYGTRIAQQYLMRFPDAVRSVVLDSVVPNSLALGQDFARNLDDALKAQFSRCANDPACKKAFGDPGQTLYQLRDALRANPHPVSFRDPQTWQTVKRMLDEDTLASVVRMFAYRPASTALLPLSINTAAHGDVGPLLGQARLLSGDLSELIGGGMQYSVICAEDADLLTDRPEDASTILGTRMVDALKTVCSIWPKGARPADFHHPLKTDKPVLLLAGQYDPVTPPRYADEVAKGLPHARVLNFRGQAHGVMTAGCGPQLIQDFIEQPDPKALDARCLDRLQPTPFFLDFNGATP